MENIEIKARITNPSGMKEKIKKFAHTFLGSDHQVDTYFSTKSGRMKLRESQLSGNYLILYRRDDKSGPRSSVYETIPIDRSAEVKSLLGNLLGLEIVVEKKRDIFLFENVRIHIDEVKNLGDFLEFEAVMDNKHQNHDREINKVNKLMKILEISNADLVAKSYQDLLCEKNM
jgi:predicted adenylyl cyclase CyaB